MLKSDSRAENIESLRKAASRLHHRGLVFGNLRGPNILIMEGDLKLVDFDWCGPEGDRVCYPVLPGEIERPKGTEGKGKIMVTHDKSWFKLPTDTDLEASLYVPLILHVCMRTLSVSKVLRHRLFRATQWGHRSKTPLKLTSIVHQNWEPKLKMVKVTANGKTIAESNQTIVVENNHYFPPNSVDQSLFIDSKTRYGPPSCLFRCSSHSLAFWMHSTVCPWKGSA